MTEAGGSPIWFATSALGQGGPDRVIMLLAQAAARAGHPATIIAGRVDEANRLRFAAATVTIVDVGNASYPVAALRRLLPKEEGSAVIATQRMVLACAAALTATRSRAKLVVRPANHPLGSLRGPARLMATKRQLATRLEALLARRVDGVVCQSHEVADAVARLGGRLAAAPRAIVANPVAVGADGPAQNGSTDGRRALPTGTPTMVSMGRLTHQKGYDLLLRALPPVVRRYPGLRLWLMGDGEDEARLRQAVVDLHLEDHVTFLGHIDEPHAVLRRADIYVMPSRYEGLSNSLIEAQAVGLPAVATTGAASGDQVVEAPRTGWLCEPGSGAALTAALLAAVEGHTRLDGSEISRLTRKKFDPDLIWARYASFIQSLPPRARRR